LDDNIILQKHHNNFTYKMNNMISQAAPASSSIFFPITWKPTSNWVIIGRGRFVKEHNKPFMDLVSDFASAYSGATTKQEKSSILDDIVEQVHARQGGFVKHSPELECYRVVEDALARTTTAQALRDQLSHMFRSSRKFKQERRQKRMEEQSVPCSSVYSLAQVAARTQPLFSHLAPLPPLRCVSPGSSIGSASRPATSSYIEPQTQVQQEPIFVPSERKFENLDYLYSAPVMPIVSSHNCDEDSLEGISFLGADTLLDCDFELFDFE
jgi:hypothetical protein